MWRKQVPVEPVTLLARAVPQVEQRETHHRVVNAPIEMVWGALERVSAVDLPLARTLMRLRPVGGALSSSPLLTSGPVPAQYLDAPRYAVGVTAHRPWAGQSGPAVDVDSAVSCPPGWVVTGTDFELHPLGAHRILLATHTRSHATSPKARRAMRLYWMLIGPFSGLVRAELLRTVARLAEDTTPRQ